MLKNYKKKIIVGIVGLGVGAFHLKNSLSYKNCKVKYICDLNKEKVIILQKNLTLKMPQLILKMLLKIKKLIQL